MRAVTLSLLVVLLCGVSIAELKQEPGAQENQDFEDVDEFDETGVDEPATVPVAATLGPGDGGLDSDGQPFAITFRHCPSVRVKSVFLEYRARLERIYPQASVTGNPIEPTQVQLVLKYALYGVQVLLSFYCWSGRRLHAKLGIAVPSWFEVIERSPLTPIMVLYYLSNMAQDRITASGSFDVAVNDKSVWATAAQDRRVPSWQELLWHLEEAGLPRVPGADDIANWPAGWQDTKVPEPGAHGEI